MAVVRGRQEFGPRALGHRSLLALPEGTEIKDRLNRLKFRQWYRPVAPMIADEDLETVFGYVAKSPYMCLGFIAISALSSVTLAKEKLVTASHDWMTE